jgi:hypothetical protein
VEILVFAGRRKATLIADALCDYMARYGGMAAPTYLPHGLQYPATQPALTTHEETAFFTPEMSHNDTEIADVDASEQTAASAEELPFADDISQAILNGLNMFTSSAEP